MGLVDKMNTQKVKKQQKKDASGLKLRHLEWLLKTIRDAEHLKGSELQLATETVQWLQNEYTRLQNEIRVK
tara:strand:+ start:379 stop:591 length:213 start_codon:yes stop_codon:yes gene_type:complete